MTKSIAQKIANAKNLRKALNRVDHCSSVELINTGDESEAVFGPTRFILYVFVDGSRLRTTFFREPEVLAAGPLATRWTWKYPRMSWESLRAAIDNRHRNPSYIMGIESNRIESLMQPGYTSEPYCQLIEISGNGDMSVVSEYDGSKWLSPLEAAGFVSRRVA
jgi:hypothetical protein